MTNDNDDIVTRLRGAASESYGCQCVKCEAADEIERLRKEVADAYSKSAQVIADLSANLCTASAMERERLTAERDEARRMWCEEAFCHRFNERRFNERCVPSPISNARQIAHNMKWDCFKEDTDD